MCPVHCNIPVNEPSIIRWIDRPFLIRGSLNFARTFTLRLTCWNYCLCFAPALSSRKNSGRLSLCAPYVLDGWRCEWRRRMNMKRLNGRWMKVMNEWWRRRIINLPNHSFITSFINSPPYVISRSVISYSFSSTIQCGPSNNFTFTLLRRLRGTSPSRV